jgi:hypothetical protein
MSGSMIGSFNRNQAPHSFKSYNSILFKRVWKTFAHVDMVGRTTLNISTKQTNSVALVRQRTMPTERPPLLGEVVPTFADRGCSVVSATNPPGRIFFKF